MRNVIPETLLAEHDFVRALARSLLRDTGRADDVAQHAMLVAAQRESRDEPPASASGLRSWLARIVRNLVRDDVRRHQRRNRHERAAARTDSAPSTRDVLEREEQRKRVVDAVLALPQPYRGVVLMRYWDGKKAAGIARELGIPSATVRAQLKRGRDLLREKLEHDGGADWRSALLPLAGLPTITATSSGAATTGVGAMLMTAQTKITFAITAVVLASLLFWAVQSLDSEPVKPSENANATLPTTADLAAEEETTKPGTTAPATVQRTAVAAAAAAKESRLLARIVDRQGRPIEGARLDAPVRTKIGEAVSDDEGHLVLVAAREELRIWRGQSLPLHFRVRADGYATHFLSAAIALDQDTNLGDLELGPGGVVVGRVVDTQGTPIADAEVVACQAPLGRSPEQARDAGPLEDGGRIRAVTNHDGEYRLPGVAAGAGRIWSHVQERGWAFTPAVDVMAARDTIAPDIVVGGVAANRRIAGIVLGPDNRPVPGATVLIGAFVDGPLRTKTIEADAAGTFSTVSLNDSEHYVQAFHPRAEMYPARKAGIRPGTAKLELRLTELRWCEVALVDERTGQPVQKPWVNVDTGRQLHHDEKVPEPKSEKLENGRVRVPIPPRSFRVGASAKNYAYRQKGPFQPQQVGDEVVIELKRKQMIRGRVTGEGSPIAGARVQTVKTLPDNIPLKTQGFRSRLFDGGQFAAKSDDQGRFEQPVSTSIKEGKHVLLVSMKGWATTELPLDVGDGDLDDVEVELTRGGAIEGKVWMPPGRDPTGALVAASNGNGIVLTTRADEQGNYRFETLTPGPWQLRHREQEQGMVMGISTELHEGPYRGDCIVREGLTTRHNVDARGNDFTVNGQLRIDGQPASGWTARLSPIREFSGDRAGKSAVLDPFGSFSLEAKGKKQTLILETLSAGKPFANLRKQLDLATMPGPFDVAFATGKIIGTTTPGKKLHVHVALANDWHYHATPTVDAQGRFELRAPAGTVEITEGKRVRRRNAPPGHFLELRAGDEVTVKVP